MLLTRVVLVAGVPVSVGIAVPAGSAEAALTPQLIFGFGSGRSDFAHGVTDFAVSDLPFLGPDPVTGVDDSSGGRSYAYVPIAGGAVAFPFHLEVGGLCCG